MAWREAEFMGRLSGNTGWSGSREIHYRRTCARVKTASENTQRPTPNVQRPMSRTGNSFCVFLCRPDAREENSDRLFAFCEDENHVFLGKHFGLFNQAESSSRFFQLFQANL